MHPLLRSTLAAVALTLPALPAVAQKESPEDRLTRAHALYYTPTSKGLQSFSCQATVPWKTLLTSVSGTEIKDDNPLLVYLNSIHLSVSDSLGSTGSLEWAATTVPQPELEVPVAKMKEGFQQMVAGFFQSWNGYLNGLMVPYPGKTITVTAAGDGLHLHQDVSGLTFDEDLDKNSLLVTAKAFSTELKVIATPTFQQTDEGLLVTNVSSVVNQPPSAPPMKVEMLLEYGKVETFRIPSKVDFVIANVGTFELAMHDCRVVTRSDEGLNFVDDKGKAKLKP